MSRKFVTLVALLVLSIVSFVATLWIDDSVAQQIFRSIFSATVLYAVLAVGVEEFFARRIADSKTRYSFRKTVSLLLMVVISIIWLRIWVPNPQALLVAYGVVAAGIAVALQDVVKNLAGSISIFLGGIYQVGNRVKINGVVGDVIDIGVFSTTLLEVGGWIDADQATGRITTVPNGAVLNQPIQNYTKHHKFLWDELSVVVTAESDWSEAMRLAGEVGHEHTKEFIEAANKSLTRLERYYYVEGHVLDPNVYIKPDQNGYSISLRYVVDAWQRRSTNSDIWGHLIRLYDEHPNIIIAPTSLATMPYPFPESGS